MIAKWKLFNFKSVRDATSLDFGPLTIFAGPNSSGKSTCIQSILLICQTLRNQIGSRSVILNGSMTRLGQFDDLKTAKSDANQILIGWELRPAAVDRLQAVESFEDEEWVTVLDGSLVSVECDVAFDARPNSQNDITQLNPQLFSTLLRTVLRDSDGLDHVIPFGLSRALDAGESQLRKLRELGIADVELDRVRASLFVRVEMDEESQQELKSRFMSEQVIGCELLHFLPQRIVLAYNRAEDQTNMLTSALFKAGRSGRHANLYIPVTGLRVLRRVLGTATGNLFEGDSDLDRVLTSSVPVLLSALFDGIRGLPAASRRQIQESFQSSVGLAEEFSAAVRSELADEFKIALRAPSQGIRASCSFTRRYFSQSVKYLGPLRDEPKALYPLASGNDPFDIGLQGENTAAVLDLHKLRLVRFIPPSAFIEAAMTPEPITRTLQAAVGEWVRYLGVAESVDSIDKGKLGHELKVQIDQNSGQQDLTHVGVGVSQILPILVMCLLADRDNALVFEQPELHLHPKVQTLLGDFFLSMALLEKQCIIETHSEYLINRLRFRAASATSDKVASGIKIYFVEKPADRSQFRQIVVNEFGAIEDWPTGFFDQSQKEAEETLRAAMKKKRQNQQRKT